MSGKNYTLAQLGWKTFFNQQLTLENLEQTAPYRITQVFRNRVIVLGENGERELNLAQFPHLQTCTVGDWLLIPKIQSDTPVILDRLSVFQRKSPGANTNQLIAANVDTAFIVSSCNNDFNLSRIERYLALAKEAQVDAVLVLTKADLINEQQLSDYLAQLHELQSHLVVLPMDALNKEKVQQLNDWCKVGQTVVLLGSSGVGKTTLSNSLCSMEEATAAIRDDDSKGRHTTTSRSLYFTQAGGLILDCPGMRELQLTDCEEGIKAVFSDIERLAKQCKFTDCQHQSEPGCKVLMALDTGDLAPRRLANYQKMLKEQARNSLTLAQSHHQDKVFGKLIKNSLKIKKSRLDP
ncbi:ribosome small subunit-dependent GTPase A [uncultured Paraglaciecola sp.]|uniref:ribosome small subunit-dependent GTPase A n=1 Tax=uncultured Paraglaciecola sp. TaxID=1765024 RepID=UPI0030D82046|tara:strand:- start:5857 stop:6909 length:1053 start_codon:yes stop_codon:yes gene_type:complete